MSDDSMLDLFRMEVEQQTAVLSAALLILDETPDAADSMEAAMRAAHSMKGAARLVDSPVIVSLTHVMEECLVAAQESVITLDHDIVDLLLQGVDLIVQVAGGDECVETHTKLIAGMEAILSGSALEPVAVGNSSSTLPVSAIDESALESLTPVIADLSMLELFKSEVDQQVVVLNDGLLELDSDATHSEQLESLMRAAHSIKGAARLVNMEPIVKIAHIMEDVFVAAQQATLQLTADKIDRLLMGADLLSEIALEVETFEHWLESNKERYEHLLLALAGVLSGESVSLKDSLEASVSSSSPAQVSIRKEKKESAQPKDRVLRIGADQINRLMGLAGESLVESRWLYPYSNSLQRLKRQQVDLIGTLDHLWACLDDEKISDEALTLARNARRKAAGCREVMAARLVELESYDRRATNLSSRLHREIVASRMRPFGDGVHGFPRMVRDISRSLGKRVKLIIDGEATMVDRDILDKIEAPLNHLIRNAIDHGLESNEEREATGKESHGVINLSASHHAGMLSITVADDGRGVDMERLREKVVAKGLIEKEISFQLDESELLEFLFLPSFSTRDSVSEISGRGVGLDVVHDVVHEMRGSVRVHSKFGKGTRFHMQLPLTLSVIPSLLVDIGGEPYAFPLARIERILSIVPAQIKEAEGNQFIEIDGKNVGLVDAAEVLGMERCSESAETLFVVMLGERNHHYGLVVSSFLGERELVVQTLPAQLGKVQGISAAALMEDGAPLLLVDVDDLIRSIEKTLKVSRVGRVAKIYEDEDDPECKRILVVDDSITVREIERKLLESSGYIVEVAVDGIDGLNALKGSHFDLLITDVDMPRMSGIELVRIVREDSVLSSLPIMMISYKDREEDKMRGLEAGADYYLTKSSFHDESMRNAVLDLIGEARIEVAQ